MIPFSCIIVFPATMTCGLFATLVDLFVRQELVGSLAVVASSVGDVGNWRKDLCLEVPDVELVSGGCMHLPPRGSYSLSSASLLLTG